MEQYQKTWTAGVVPMLTVGAGLGFVTLTVNAIITTGIFAIPTAAVCVVVFPYRTRTGDEGLIRRSAARAALVCGCVFGLVGLTAVMGAALVPILLIATVASPRAVDLLRAQTGKARRSLRPTDVGQGFGPGRAEPPPHSLFLSPAAINVMVNGLSTAELCKAWRVTYRGVVRAKTTYELATLYSLRAAYLDELERRDPEAFTEWMCPDGQASGDPAALFTPKPNSQQ